MTEEQLNTLNELFEETKYKELIAGVENQGLDLDNSFLPNLALSYFHTENYDKSTELFEKVCENSQDSVQWFNLSMSAILNKNELRGLEALRNAMKHNKETATNGKGIPTSFMLMYSANAFYDAGRYNHAYNQMNELSEIYGSVSITDSHFLYTRGIPFFEEFLKLAKKILPKQQVVSPKDWIPYVSLHLDEEGKAAMQELLKNI